MITEEGRKIEREKRKALVSKISNRLKKLAEEIKQNKANRNAKMRQKRWGDLISCSEFARPQGEFTLLCILQASLRGKTHIKSLKRPNFPLYEAGVLRVHPDKFPLEIGEKETTELIDYAKSIAVSLKS